MTSKKIVECPWGKYEIISEDKTNKIKKITINPGHRLSLQYHQHRTEYWVIISGNGIVTYDDKVRPMEEKEIITIHQGVKHRIENSGTEALVLIEVQCGDYLGEDDIVRLDDDYHRVE